MNCRYIPLFDWAKRTLDPPPSIRTLRSWARTGRIHPKPMMIGREYRVREDAVLVDRQAHVHIEKAVINSKDPVVNDIIKSGKTSKLRKA